MYRLIDVRPTPVLSARRSANCLVNTRKLRLSCYTADPLPTHRSAADKPVAIKSSIQSVSSMSTCSALISRDPRIRLPLSRFSTSKRNYSEVRHFKPQNIVWGWAGSNYRKLT